MALLGSVVELSLPAVHGVACSLVRALLICLRWVDYGRLLFLLVHLGGSALFAHGEGIEQILVEIRAICGLE